MKEFFKQRYTDAFALIIIPAISFFSFSAMANASSIYFLLMIGVAFFLVAIRYRDDFRSFAKTVIGAIVATDALTAVLLLREGGPAAGYLFLVWFSCFVYFALTALGVFFVVKVYYFLLGNRIKLFANRVVLTLFFVFVVVGIVVGAKSSLGNHAESSVVLEQRGKFIRRIESLVGNNQLTLFTNKELIDKGVVSGVYETNGEQIFYGYGGNVRIERAGQDIHLVFDGVPSGDRCFRFYFVNNPRYEGFTTTKVDSVTVSSKDQTMPEDDPSKKGPCYSGKEKVSIEFIGSLEDVMAEFKDSEQIRQRILKEEGPQGLVGSMADPWQ